MIKQIYDKLIKEYGPQGWWPVTEGGRLEIIFGAILTQNTSWKNVEKAIDNLNKEDLIDLEKIKKIKKDKLASTIRSSVYYNQKAQKLNVPILSEEEFLSMLS